MHRFSKYRAENRQTDSGENPTPATTVGMVIKFKDRSAEKIKSTLY